MIVICDLIYLGQFDYNTQTTNCSIYYQRSHLLASTVSTKPDFYCFEAAIPKMTSNVSWLEEKFVDCSVALALTLVNETNEFTLEHRQTYFHDGCGDPFYDIPPTILPKVFFLNLFVWLSICMSICLSICHQRYQRVHPWTSPDLFSRWLWRSVVCYDVPSTIPPKVFFFDESLSVYLSNCLFVFVWISVSLSECLYVILSVCLNFKMSLYHSVCLSKFLNVSLSFCL